MNVKDYQQRVIDEVEELDEKIEKLDAFTGTDNFYSLPSVEQELLCKQLQHMRDYSSVLRKRINLFAKQNRR